MFDFFVNENFNFYFYLMNIEVFLIDLISKYFMLYIGNYWWYFRSSFGLVVWLLGLICKIILDRYLFKVFGVF